MNYRRKEEINKMKEKVFIILVLNLVAGNSFI